MDVALQEVSPPNFHVCGKCSTKTDESTLRNVEYRCPTCNFEMACLDFAPDGTIRGVFGYLRSVGDVIQDRYRVENVLGKGGYGATYLVEDLKLKGKRRALREIPELLFDEHEVSLLSQLHHPAIPEIIDRCVADGMIYLVLEFGGARTLGDECRRLGGRVPLAVLLSWMDQLCDALGYLHSQSPPIIHRDLKPESILLDDYERILLIDFGIAKKSLPSDTTRTVARSISHGFSPPERMLGTETDKRSDIYALAATFYFLLSGEVPPSPPERVTGKEIRPLSEMVPGLPPVVEEVLSASLSLDISHRPSNVEELRRAVGALDVSHAAAFVQDCRTVLLDSRRRGPNGLPPGASLRGVNICTGEPVFFGTAGSGKPEWASHRLWPALLAGAVMWAAIGALGYSYWHKGKNEAQVKVRTEQVIRVQSPVAPATRKTGPPPPQDPSNPGESDSDGGAPIVAAAPAPPPSEVVAVKPVPQPDASAPGVEKKTLPLGGRGPDTRSTEG